MRRTLVVTNDFPPRPGGIQQFVHQVVGRLPADDVVVLTSPHEGDAAFDATLPYRVVRHRHYPMVPTPAVAGLAADLLREEKCEAVWFGAAAPLAVMTPALRRAGAVRTVATTHGHEMAWARLPGAASVLRRISARVDVLTYLTEYSRAAIGKVAAAGARLEQLSPGVDPAVFSPEVSGLAVRERYDLAGRPVVVCVSRLVRRKGQDTLIDVWPLVLEQVPDAALLIVSGGPYGHRLASMVRSRGLEASVHLTGQVDWSELPQHYAAGDLFAMPCRTRRAGLDVEGLGIVFLEASASGLPVIAGRSGGAPDAVLEGRTGYVVDPRDRQEITARIVELLLDPVSARTMGVVGRAWAEREWGWDAMAGRLSRWLSE
ncbi:MAG: phosphatidyl-myo-inositol dimannoside synthase [Frankiales bacterium]|jgi:phosphatidylinositol alpha-1,6-mannosyltransferase|nr:phosphatidyl-myo-inositol dimannoside synthase [Frankiales bacterium]